MTVLIVSCALLGLGLALWLLGYLIARAYAWLPTGPRQFLKDYAPLLAAAVTVALGVLVLAALVDAVREQADITLYDPQVAARAYAIRTWWLTPIALALTFVGGSAGLGVLSAVVLIVLLARRRFAPGAMFGAAMGVSLLLTIVLKDVFGRHRPAANEMIGPVLTSFSFPSGHTLNSTVFCGMLAGILLLSLRSRAARISVIAAAVALPVCVGLSRIYLGFHWLTDVFGGWAIGAILVATAALVFQLREFRFKRGHRPVLPRLQPPAIKGTHTPGEASEKS